MKVYKLKSLFFPSNISVRVNALETWSVTWSKRTGRFSGDVEDCKEFFLTNEEAVAFADSLCNAYKLLRHTSGTNVTIKKE